VLLLGIVIVIAAGYLLGSIPTGYLVARARGVDIRAMGSGNIGATNVFRILGTPAGVFVLLADAAKGWLAVYCATIVVIRGYGSGMADWGVWLVAVGGVSAVLGHVYTVWLGFKGGKGIATSAGVLTGLAPMAVVIAVTLWVIVLFLSRYVSLASIGAAVVLPFAVWFCGYGGALTAATALLAALAIYKHRSNMERLMKGTESKFGRKPASGSGGKS
jgi:glycerol-3-phosphate acyltransferase PlsY